jgi:hypothetical protein
VAKVEASGAASARAMFAKMDSSAKPAPTGTDKAKDVSWKAHQSAVTSISAAGGLPSDAATFAAICTTSMDGRLVTWDLTKTAVSGAALGL